MKRFFDTLLILLSFVIVLPLLILGLLLVVVFDGPPIFFLQNRVGLNGKDFKVIKFRTMLVDLKSEKGIFNFENSSRVTNIGKLLRKTKLDELPQLWNVLVGEMSIVGPRPEVRKWVDEFPDQWSVIHQVRPGITDPASIIYRNEEQLLSQVKYPEKYYREKILPGKLALYQKYINERTIIKDFFIIFKTIVALFK
jgi:lipopolysaccharide/colanic/teichoic acid biosynthesis glycosyltransferase